MTKKILLLAGMALALVAFAAPAVAAAQDTLLDNGATVADKEAELSGEIGFSSLGGGIDCTAHAKITINSLVVRVVSLNITTSTCKGTGGLSGCTVTTDSVTNLPWTVDVLTKPSRLTITNVTIHNTLSPTVGKVCSPKNLTVEFASVTATPDNAAAIKKVTIEGEGTATIEGVAVEAEASGSLSVVGANSGTYQIGETAV